jgi:hypothetical protein
MQARPRDRYETSGLGEPPDERLTGVEEYPKIPVSPFATCGGRCPHGRARDPNANGDRQLNQPTGRHHVPDRLSNRKAVGLLLAFLAVVILVGVLATIPLPAERSTPDGPTGNNQSRGWIPERS